MSKKYTLSEELSNSISHGIGAILSIVALFLLVNKQSENPSFTLTISIIVYAITMFLLFLSSCLYHAVPHEKLKSKLKTLDHCAIFLLIAGTYTPFTLVVLPKPTGLILFFVIWAFAVLGIFLNTLSVTKYHKFSLICYVAMGWAVIFTLKPLINALDPFGIVLLTLGGVAYTTGIPFYLQKRKYMHTIWHLFVLLGCALHFFTIYFYVA